MVSSRGPTWTRFLSILVIVSSANAYELTEQAITAHGAFIGHHNSVMRSNPWPPLRPDTEQEASVSESLAEIHTADEDHIREALDAAQVPVPVNGSANITMNVTTLNVTLQKSVANSIGIMLLGMVTFIMSLFYATHFPDSDVQHATWVTLSEAISLFTAVLIFTSFKDIMVLQFGEGGGHSSVVPDTKSMITSFLRMLIAFWGMQALLLKYRRTDLPLKAWASIGGNVVAFAAIDSFGMIQQFPPFRDNPANAFMGCAIAGFMIMCMTYSAHIVRHYVMTYEDGIIKEHENNWNEACKEAENRLAAICLGLLFSVVVRFAISGSLPAIWGSPHNKSQDQVNTLFGVSLGLALPVFAMSMTVSALETSAGRMPGIVRAAKVAQLVVSMCMGWSLVFCGQWEFWSATKGAGVGLGDKMTARMIDALIFSYISFGFIIVLDFAADKMQMARSAFNAVSNSFVLGLGIAWQGAFSEACSAMSERFEDATTRAYMDAFITMILCAIVLPAWVMYMLPRALAGPQPLDGDKKKDGGQNGDGGQGGTAMGEEGDQEDGGEAQATSDVGDAQAAKVSFCNSCGSQFEDGAQFCQNCGGKRAEDSAEPVAAVGGKAFAEPDPAGGAGGGKANASGGKAAASGGKGGRGSTGKANNVPPAPAATPAWDENANWDQQESWDQNDDSWNNEAPQEPAGVSF